MSDYPLWENAWYIPVAYGEKLPAWSWGGYDQDFDEAEEVYTLEEAAESDHGRWGYIDVQENEWELAIIDLDFYKDDCPYDIDDFTGKTGVLKHLIKTPSGGMHVPLLLPADREAEVRVADGFRDWVDLKGAVGKGHCLVPTDNSDYEYGDESQWEEDGYPAKVHIADLPEAVPHSEEHGAVLEAVSEREYGLNPDMSDFDPPGEVYQLLDKAEYPVDSREPHPFHGCDNSDGNFDVMPGTGAQFWRCWRHETSGTLLHLLGMHYGEYECGDWERMDPAERAETHRRVRARARDDGFEIERRRAWRGSLAEYAREADVHEGEGGGDKGALRRIREGTEDMLGKLMDEHRTRGHGVVTSYPNSGKSFGFHKNLQERDRGGTILQPNRELRAETADSAEEEHALDVFDLPSFPHDSPLLDEDSDWYSATAAEWYERGMPPRAIYERLPDSETPDGGEDEYRRKMEADWGDTDLAVGDPVHAFLERAVSGRHVAMDDIDPYSSFVDEYELNRDDVREPVMEWLGHHADELAEAGATVEAWDDVTKPDKRTADAIVALADESPSRGDIPETDKVTADASRVARVLALTSGRGEDRAEWTEPGGVAGGAGTKFTGARVGDHVIVAGLPLNLRHAETLLMLTATPVVPVFRQVFEDLRLSSGLHDSMDREQRREYFDRVLGATVVQTTEASRFVSGGSNTRPAKLRATVREIEELHGERPLLVSSKKALEGPLSPVVAEMGLDTCNFARAVGTNQFEGEELALVWGAPHYGDDYVKRVAAFCGDTDAEPIREEGEETRWSTEVSQAIYDNMTEGTVFQAMLRVGRSSDAHATIYVETDKVPDDVPRHRPEGHDLLRMLSDREHEVCQAISALGTATASDVAEATDVPRRTVYDVLSRLAGEGALDVVGTGSYGADEYALALEWAAEEERRGGLTESARDGLTSILMAETRGLTEHRPTFTPTERVLTDAGGVEPALVEAEQPDSPQMELDEYG